MVLHDLGREFLGAGDRTPSADHETVVAHPDPRAPGVKNGLVFATSIGTKMLAGNVRRDFRRALALVPDLNPSMWTPRELRHSFVSVLSDAGVPVEDISQLVGHSGTTVTELVYRHQLRPVIQTGAKVMDRLFSRDRRQAD